MKKLFSRKSPSQKKTSEKKPEDPMLEHYHTRLKGKFVVAVIYLIQIFTRFLSLVEWKEISAQARLYTWISLAFCFPIPIIITLEYILFRKKGLKMLKHSSLMNGILLFCFIGDWISNEVSCLYVIQGTNPYVAKLIVLLGFTSYAWRTLIVTFIVQNWKLKPLAPSLAIIGVAAFIIIYGTHHLRNVLLGALLQIQLVFIIIQFEEKWKWKLTWTNLKQDQWIQMNDLILNNVPENIMILDMSGEAKFINEQCKTFLKKSNLEAKDFLKRVQDLQRLHDIAVDSEIPVLDNLNMARQASNHEFLEIKAGSMEKAEFLEDLVMDIRNKASLQGGQFLVYNGKLKMPREDGQAEEEDEKSIEVKISCVRNIDKNYLVLTLRDTTQREDHMDTSAEAEANKYKDTLLASVSHELRAPLNGNINLVETAIHSPKVPDRIKESLLIPASRYSKVLLHKINDLLDMAQLKEKKLRLVFQSEDLKETLKSAAQLVELQAKKKGIELELEFDANLPKKFSTDHIRLSQIVLNLLANAIKFTKEGVVKLTVAPVNRTSWIKISVKDSGIGIIPDDIKKLFSNSTHIDYEGRQATNPTGVGLGLNVSDKLAELLSPASKQQGIQVVSALNQGSTFSFIIEDKKTQEQSLNEPFEIASQENSRSNNFTENEISEELPELQSRAFSQLQLLARSSSLCSEAVQSESDVCSCPKVLIVDDNPFNTMTLETILNSLEIKCDAVYSGSACIESLMNRQKKPCCKNCESYSVVFIDQEMPEMDGVETVAEIKRLQSEGSIPKMKLVGCTTQRSDEEREKFLEAGLDQCICQPVTTGMIKDILS